MGDIKNLGPLRLFPLLWAQYLKGFYRSGLSAASLLIWPQPPNNVCVSPADHSLWLATYEIIKVLKLSSGLKWPLECKHSPCGWLSSWGGGDCSAAGSSWLAPPFSSHWKRVFPWILDSRDASFHRCLPLPRYLRREVRFYCVRFTQWNHHLYTTSPRVGHVWIALITESCPSQCARYWLQ